MTEKRNRPPASCEPCRARKLKCNRSLPCDSCNKRSKSDQCHYASNADRGRAGTQKAQRLRDRLGELEKFVASLASQTSTSTGTPDIQTSSLTSIHPFATSLIRVSDKDGQLTQSASQAGISTPGTSTSTPTLHVSSKGELSYLDPSHWKSFLEEIKEVKEVLSDVERQTPEDTRQDHQEISSFDASFLYDPGRSDVRPALQLLPSRSLCDMLVSYYFNLPSMVLAIVHPVKFQTEYAAFWQSPLDVEPLWLALLLAILSVAVTLRRFTHPSEELVKSISPTALQRATLQCLVIGKYASSNEYALEAFLLHLQCLFVSKRSNSNTTWFEMGTIIRLAFRMAYHRDPDTLPNITPFAGEIRRRIWLNLVQIEALLSYQAGFPTVIHADFCDTRPPRNLHYSDLSPDMTVLPPSRPLTEHTPVLYSIVKEGIMKVFKKIVAHDQFLQSPEFAKTLDLDREMRKAYMDLPQSYQRRNISESLLDSSVLIFERCTIETLYLKGLIVLHRRWVNYQKDERVSHAPARMRLLGAAYQMLERFDDLYRACEPGGRLHEDRAMFLAIPPWDFLLATMVINLDLSREIDYLGEMELTGFEDKDREKQIEVLTAAQRIWEPMVKDSPHARIAASVTKEVLQRVKKSYSKNQDLSTIDNDTTDAREMQAEIAFTGFLDGNEPVDWSLMDHCFLDMDDVISSTIWQDPFLT